MSRLLAAALLSSMSVISVLPAAQAAATPTREWVTGQCALVATEEYNSKDQADRIHAGQCVAATSEYLAYLLSQATSERGTLVSALVVDLAILLQDRCKLDSEIAEAIRLAAAYVEDKKQGAQILLVADTVQQCDYTRTASILTPPSIVDRSSGLPASAN